MKPVDFGPAALHLPRNQGVQQPTADTNQETQDTQGTDSSGPAVEVALSEDAETFLQQGGPASHSTAGRARMALGQFEGLQSLPFGKIVSALARGIDPASLIATTEETGETPPEDSEPVVAPLSVEEAPVEEEPAEEPVVGETPDDTPDPILQGEDIALALLSQDGEEEPLL